jgi:tellurite resistance protein TerC
MTEPPHTSIWFWIAFNAGVLVLLALDLFVFHKKAREVSLKEAAGWSTLWVTISLAFNVLVWKWRGPQQGLEFLSGYLVEYSLSVDNIFVFVLIFSHFRVPPEFQHRVLFWGILGALVMRGVMIALGVTLVTSFHWILYIFGVFLLLTGVKILLSKQEEDIDPEANPLVKFVSARLPMTRNYRGQKFFVRENGRLLGTPLILVLVMVESTDLLFAVDSIPAIFGITRDPFIIYTSNVCAILGLRSLYFLLAGVVRKLAYLRYGLGGVLAFIGIKMLIADLYKIPITVSLLVVAGMLLASVVVSLVVAARQRRQNQDEQ